MYLLRAVEDLLLPVRCPGCTRRAAPVLCPHCADAVEDQALPDAGATMLAEGVAAAGLYAYDGAVRDVIRGMKAGGRWAAAGGLGALLRDRLGLPPADQIATTWVPSTRWRRRSRGFELTRLLAGPGAVPLLVKVADRPDQTSLDAAARRRSPIGAFRATGPVPPALVLIDDVRTTGATATAAALALRAAGARRVLVATLAVGGDDARAEAASA